MTLDNVRYLARYRREPAPDERPQLEIIDAIDADDDDAFLYEGGLIAVPDLDEAER